MQALRYLRQKAFSPLLARREVAHVVILTTSGRSSRDARQVAQEAALLRKRGVYLYVVSAASGPGHVDGRRDLSEITSDPRDQFVFSSKDRGIVDSLIDLLHVKECNCESATCSG